ncbi:Hsp20/alpha crystallin family protein [Halanaerobacter jeridensis]|uniref:HSP20 family protein n=1 Tax=Halanaerobacter jeridensis TaxID=706427 RepID=A0A938XTR7_9FIRM|nr:Hsp20/alpha crystallin family protein [Halanaerobacter jeridensis]MBM7555407.1 HSP20 family protein [Halanaerobacter jeridensis]
MFDLMTSNNKKGQVSKQNRQPRDLFSSVLEDFMDLNDITGFKTDIKETDDAYTIEAELPGMDKENIDLELNNNYLTITADNEEVIEEEKDNYIRKERRTGKYQRSFRLSNVKQDEIEAEYNDGILEVNLPKLEDDKEKRKTIDIK